MRNFAAATVVAVATAVLVAGALVVTVVGSVESLGALSGRTSIALTDLPVTQSKATQVATIERLAHRSAVSVSVLVPDRDGRADVWNAYSFRGTPSPPVFRGTISVAPVGDGGELSLAATYIVDGSASDIAAFLDGIRRSGYKYADISPHVIEALAATLEQPATLAAVLATALGVLIALVAESTRRTSRQRLRFATGWSQRAVAAREAREMGALVGFMVVILGVVVGTVFAVRHATGPVLRFTAMELAVVLIPTVGLLVALHVVLALVTFQKPEPGAVARWPAVVVATVGIALVVLGTADLQTTSERRAQSRSLEQTLVREAGHGDDVVLGTSPTEFDQDVALGRIALGPLRDGTASMAQASFVDELTLVGDASAALEEYTDQIAAGNGDPVLLVPEELAAHARALQQAASEELAESWKVEGLESPQQQSVHAAVVPSTASIARSVLDWTSALTPEIPTWPEVPVLVVPDPADIAPNRLGTTVANGEVRFSDRAALERAVHRADLDDIVLQYRRVGTTVEGELAALRSERRTAGVALLATVFAVVFAGFTLTVDHRTRTRRAARLRFLTGRHPIVHHRRFVITGAVLATGAAAATWAQLDPGSTASLPIAAITPVAVALVTVALVTVMLVVTAREGRGER